jgi:hypothetical protein
MGSVPSTLEPANREGAVHSPDPQNPVFVVSIENYRVQRVWASAEMELDTITTKARNSLGDFQFCSFGAFARTRYKPAVPNVAFGSHSRRSGRSSRCFGMGGNSKHYEVSQFAVQFPGTNTRYIPFGKITFTKELIEAGGTVKVGS